MTDYAKTTTPALIELFIDGTSRLGSAFNLPLKMSPFVPEAERISSEIQKVAAELRIRKPLAELRRLFDHPNFDVRAWAAGQFEEIDPEWASAVYGAIREKLPTQKVVEMMRHALKPPPQQPALSEMSFVQLLARFEDTCARRYGACFLTNDEGLQDWQTRNRIVRETNLVVEELKKRGTIGMLTEFLDHPNFIARYVAAIHCLPLDPDRAIPIIEDMAGRNILGDSIGAAEILRKWRSAASGTASK
ncbi:DUF2019 domain-containing protein [Methyloferula stellata]|uniref:DUF2019 domain-containing protein n=1 Tax=Methyloferula stellata TaxID=876270 RepID=UPI00036CCB95|nr:DUF2019 domain-containing protein [Methyloferula stellata]